MSPVALLGVELERPAADVAFGVRGAAFAGDGREALEDLRLLADLREELRLREPADIVSDGERPERTRALGVHPPFGDHLPVEVRELLQQPHVL
jgi:hypothetical protein